MRSRISQIWTIDETGAMGGRRATGSMVKTGLTGHNYFHDLVKHVEEEEKDDSTSAQAQLISLEAKQEKGEKISINELGLMGALRRMAKVA